jgi:hypothetical protein
MRTGVPGHPGIGPGGRSPANYHITYGHEAEAKAAQRAKKPTRIGLFVLRLLGFKGPVLTNAERPDPRMATPSHRHPPQDSEGAK